MASTTRASLLLSRQLRQATLKQSSFISRTAATPSTRISSLLQRRVSPFTSRQVAAFSTSSQKKILPAGPQIIKGGVNDPAPVPPPHPTHGSYHWIAERAVSVALVPLTLAPFAGTAMYPTLDALLVATLLLHSHMGFQAVITDYIPMDRLPGVRKLFDWLLLFATLLVGVGFYEFETNDVGLTEGIKRIWHAGKNDATVGKVDVGALGHDGKLKHLTE